MSRKCQGTNIPTVNEDSIECCKLTPSNCVVMSEAVPCLQLGKGKTLTEAFNRLCKNLKTGSKTIVESGSDETIVTSNTVGTTTTYTVSATIPSQGDIVVESGSDNVNVTPTTVGNTTTYTVSVDESCGCVIETTQDNLENNLILNNLLEPGATYKITGVHPTLYDDGTTSGTTIFLKALSKNKLTTNGNGIFYNPRYDQNVQGFGIYSNFMRGDLTSIVGNFDVSGREPVTTDNGATGVIYTKGLIKYVSGDWGASTSITGDNSGATANIANFTKPTYAINSTIIWGGYVWNNLNGNLGEDLDLLNLDSEWEKIVYNDVDYNKVLDIIEYDIESDFITRRYDSVNSIDVRFNKVTSDFFVEKYGIEFNAIAVMQWGNGFSLSSGESIGLLNINIIDSYFENINFRGSFQANIKFDNGSNQSNLTFDNYSYQQNLTFDNYSYQQNLTFDNGSYQSNITFDNNSGQSNITFDNESNQQYLTFNNGSNQYNLTFDNGSSQQNLTFDNYSYQQNLTFDNGSSQSNLTFDNYSNQQNLTFDNNSSQSNLTFNSSSQQSLTFYNNSKQQNLTFYNNSSQSNLTFDNNSIQENLTFGNNSSQENLTFNSSNQYNLTFNSSSQQSLTFYNDSSQQNLTFDNIQLNYDSIFYIGKLIRNLRGIGSGSTITVPDLTSATNIFDNTLIKEIVTTPNGTVKIKYLDDTLNYQFVDLDS